VVRRALAGHVTDEMQRHYSTVGLDETRAAIAGVLRLEVGVKRKTARCSSRRLRSHRLLSPVSVERDTGFEPATFSLGMPGSILASR
jgi:hypothetical protein